MNTNFKVIGLTRIGPKPKSTTLVADVLTSGLSELFIICVILIENNAIVVELFYACLVYLF